MKIKRFLAPDMRQAMRDVRAEQGADAVILSTRRLEGGMEIIAAASEVERDERVRQAMISNAGTLLSGECVTSCLTVIPAQAGIQLNMRPKDTFFCMSSAAHDVFALDSGLRRNDGAAGLSIHMQGIAAEVPT